MQQQELLEQLQKKSWEVQFDEGVVSIARSQEGSWRSTSLRWVPGDQGGRLSSDVSFRSSYNTYATSAHIALTKDALEINTQCSCKASGCEHAYLMLRAFIKDGRARDAFNPAPISSWMHKIAQAKTAVVVAEPSARLALVVSTYSERRHALANDLTVVPMMIGAEGNERQLRTVQARRLATADQRQLGHICVTAHDPVPRQTPAAFFIRESIQEDVLLECLADQRVFASAGEPPLSLGAVVKPVFHWQLGDHGTQHLIAHGPDGAPLAIVALGFCAWYIDPTKHVMGRLQGSLAEWQAWRAAPVIRREHATAAYEIWDKLEGGRDIARPLDLNAPVTKTGKAYPRLTTRIGTVALGDGVTVTVPVLTLTYDYNGVSLTEDNFDTQGVATRVLQGQMVKIVRHPAACERLQKSLQAIGMQGREANTPYAYLEPGDYVYSAAIKDQGAFLNALTLIEGGVDLSHAIDRRALSKPRKLTAADQYGKLVASANSSWFDLELGIEIDGQKHRMEQILTGLLDDPLFNLTSSQDIPWAVTLDTGEVVTLPISLLKGIMGPLTEWLQRRRSGSVQDTRLTMTQAAVLAEGLGKAIDGRTLKGLRGALRHLANLGDHPLPEAPKQLKATLRPYQFEGLRWLNALAEASMDAKIPLGGVLADDMGLGKTLQVIAHILWLRDKGWLYPGAPALIVVPKSLVDNWVKELIKFAPSLRRHVFEGSAEARAACMLNMAGVDVVITTYDFMVRDAEEMAKQPFSLIVSDEGQRAKNIRSKAAAVLRTLRDGSWRLVDMSGTVLENNLLELYSHVDLAVPGLLGDAKSFKSAYATPIEKHQDIDRLTQLRRVIAPFVMRRTKAQVAKDLPPKTEVVHYVEMESEQAALYESMRLMVSAQVREAVKRRGIKQANIEILDALMKLRQVCCDPRLVKLPSARNVTSSAKLDGLFDLIETAVAEGRRILIFSAFTQMLDLIAQEATKRNIVYLMLTGSTRDRPTVISEFQEGTAPLFLLSLKAGGVGLNLTAADTVIHYDPWFNPAAEAQASDRAHRIGQDKPVFVFKLLTRHTVEEKISALQARKAGLAEAIYGSDDNAAKGLAFTEADVVELFGD